MSRVRTGHGPQDWSAPDDGRPARMEGGLMGGQLVIGDPAPSGGNRRGSKKPPVNMNDYARENRWEGMPRCGVMMKQAKMPCVRIAGHRREHRTIEALEYNREIRRRVAS